MVEENQSLDFQNIIWFNCGKGEIETDGKLVLIDHSNEVWVHYTYNVKEPPRHACYYKRRNMVVIDALPLYAHSPIPIKKQKLMSKC